MRVSYRPDLSSGVGVLTRQAKVQHVALPVGRGKSTHGKVGLWDRSDGGMEESEDRNREEGEEEGDKNVGKEGEKEKRENER